MTTITFQVSIPVDALVPMLRAMWLSGASYSMPDAAQPPVGEFAEMDPLDAARVALKRRGLSTTREVHDELVVGGLKSDSKNLMNSLGVSMSKANDIVADRPGKGKRWRLKTPEEMQEGKGQTP